MINRILIRIKVVQILYSFLLTERKFEFEKLPENATKERQYAYNLYRDLLVLLVLSSRRIQFHRGEYPLLQSRFINRIVEDLDFRDMLMTVEQGSRLGVLAANLAEVIEASDVYQGYLKMLKKDVVTSEEDMWPELFSRVIFPSPFVKEYASRLDNYTEKGYERAEKMILDTLSNFMGSQDYLPDGLKTLKTSLNKARELYFRLLALAVDLTDLQERKLDDRRHNLLKSNADLFPNLKFVENKAIDQLRSNPVFGNYIEQNKVYWYQEDPLLMENLLKAVLKSDIYLQYMENPERSMVEDCALWRDLMRKVIFVNENFLETLEEKSVFWNDDLDIIGTFVVKTFRRLEEGNLSPILDDYKDEEDKRFGPELMRYVFENREVYSEWIDEACANTDWEADRLAFLDRVVILTALAEIINFPKIPLKVSINEYIEIAKSYGSAKSGTFVNGLLSRIITKLQGDGIIKKM